MWNCGTSSKRKRKSGTLPESSLPSYESRQSRLSRGGLVAHWALAPWVTSHFNHSSSNWHNPQIKPPASPIISTSLRGFVPFFTIFGTGPILMIVISLLQGLPGTSRQKGDGQPTTSLDHVSMLRDCLRSPYGVRSTLYCTSGWHYQP